jgi:WD40 repeat protein
VRVWDPVNGAARHIFTGHTGWVQALTVAPDGSWLASPGMRAKTADAGFHAVDVTSNGRRARVRAMNHETPRQLMTRRTG